MLSGYRRIHCTSCPASAVLDVYHKSPALTLGKSFCAYQGTSEHRSAQLVNASSVFDSSPQENLQTALLKQLEQVSGVSDALGQGGWQQVQEHLRHYAFKGEFERASRVLLQLLAAEPEHLDTRAASAVVAGLCRKSQFRRAWRLYAKLSASSIELTRYSYRLLLQSALQAGQPPQAVQVFRHMQELNMVTTAAHWCELIDGLASLRQKGAGPRRLPLQLWNELQNSGAVLDAWAFTSGMNACVMAGQLDAAQRILEDMRHAGLPVSTRCYNILLKGHAQQTNVDAMKATMADLLAAGLSPTAATYNTLLNSLVETEQFAEAHTLAEQAHKALGPLNVRTYTTLIKGHLLAGHMSQAQAVLRLMRSVQVPANVWTYSAIMEGFAKQGDVAACKQLLADMEASGVAPNAVTYNILLRAAVHSASMLKAAEPVLEAMAEAGVAPGVDTFNTLMRAALSLCCPGAVPGLFRQLLQDGLRPTAVSFTALITALTRLDKPYDAVRAFEVLQGSTNFDMDPPAVTAGAAALVRADRIVQAQELLLQHSPPGGVPNLFGWGAVVAGYVRCHDPTGAVAALSCFCKLGGQPDTFMLDGIIQLCLVRHDRAHAAQVIAVLQDAGICSHNKQLQAAMAEMDRYHQQLSQGTRSSGSTQPAASNEYLERFKFWVGLPNKYYSAAEWDSER